MNGRSILLSVGAKPSGGLRRVVGQFFAVALFAWGALGQEGGSILATDPLTMRGDLSAQMVAGIDRFLDGQTEQVRRRREAAWTAPGTSPEARARFADQMREQLRRRLGMKDPRLPNPRFEHYSNEGRSSKIAEAEGITAWTVRWPVFDGVVGEGILLEPRPSTRRAQVVAIPDANDSPESIAGLGAVRSSDDPFALRLARAGCRVLVVTLIDRACDFSGNEVIRRFTNQPHREWIYRQAFELGRTLIGLEVAKVQSAIDCFAALDEKADVLVAGHGEGGRLALTSAALDTRVTGAWVSGSFGPRDRLWREPIDRNVFGQLLEFSDAEVGALIYPRELVVDARRPGPSVSGPPAPRPGRTGAAPGTLEPIPREDVEREWAVMGKIVGDETWASLWISGPISTASVRRESARGVLASALEEGRAPSTTRDWIDARAEFDPKARMRRQVGDLVTFLQARMRRASAIREERLRKAMADQPKGALGEEYRAALRDEVIGRFTIALEPPRPRTRLLGRRDGFTLHEVVLDVWPSVFAWGYLLIPDGIKEGERRAAVVCQHGLEGLPSDVVNEDPKTQAHRYYKGFAARLARKGFVVYAPHNPYRGEDRFRVLQRKANPIGRSLFSVIVAQHEQLLNWLGSLPMVDARRIGFYGLSYGGKTAMRVPALLPRYALSICSADFNDWIVKNVTVEDGHSYLFTGEYEMPEWNLGETYNYAEMAALIAPRPFMVERGHADGVAPDEWVAHEFAKVRRFYVQRGIGERAEIEFFDGPHTINGQGTFSFLSRWLNGSTRDAKVESAIQAR